MKWFLILYYFQYFQGKTSEMLKLPQDSEKLLAYLGKIKRWKGIVKDISDDNSVKTKIIYFIQQNDQY